MKFNNNIARKLSTRYTAMMVVFAFMISACSDFLKETPPSNITTNAKLTSVQSGTAWTIGPYRSLPLWIGGADDWGNYLPGPIEYQTGKAFTTDAHVQFWKFAGDQVSGDLLGDFVNFWNNQYQGVRDCNLSISLLPTVTDMTDVNKQIALGEVRALRGWYYFTLVRYFGDVVMNVEVNTDPTKFEQPRVSLKKIYDEVIIPDLEFAVNTSGLSDARSTNGRVTRDVARAILADVYLTAAGYPYQEIAAVGDKNWSVEGLWSQKGYPVNSNSSKDFLQKAKVQLDALVSSGRYSLFPSYDDLRDPGKNNTAEAVFQAQYQSNVVSSSGIQGASFPLGSRLSMYGDENGTYVPSIEYYNSYSAADKRKQEKQFFFTSDFKSSRYGAANGTTPCDPFQQPHLYKFYDVSATKVTASSGLNWNYYRYADILLMQTEVNWTLNNVGVAVPAIDILFGINLVRSRATLPALTIGNCDLRAIMSERAYELIFENKMLWDMRRTRMALVDGAGTFSALVDFVGHQPNGFSYKFGAKHLLSPIGLTEIQNNRQALQNFGYLPKQVGQSN